MITLIPYVEIDGARTVSDSVVKEAFRKTVQDKTHTTVFYDGKIKTEDEFLDLMKDPKNLPVFVLVDDKLSGYAWINSIADNHAFAHFNFFKETWGKCAEDIGKSLLDYWFSFPGSNGPMFDVLIGMIPKFNTKANRFIERLGFVRVGEIPMMLRNAYAGERTAAVLSYKTR